MEAQMALARGGLAVPLKIFTKVALVQNKKPPTPVVKKRGGLYLPTLRVQDETGRLNLKNIQPPTSNSQHPVKAPRSCHWMFDVGWWMLPEVR
jgi:hypothetical protein